MRHSVAEPEESRGRRRHLVAYLRYESPELSTIGQVLRCRSLGEVLAKPAGKWGSAPFCPSPARSSPDCGERREIDFVIYGASRARRGLLSQRSNPRSL